MTIPTLRALLSAATPGPWTSWHLTGHDSDGAYIRLAESRASRIGETESAADADLIVSLVNAAPVLLDVLEAALAWWDARDAYWAWANAPGQKHWNKELTGAVDDTAGKLEAAVDRARAGMEGYRNGTP